MSLASDDAIIHGVNPSEVTRVASEGKGDFEEVGIVQALQYPVIIETHPGLLAIERSESKVAIHRDEGYHE